MQIQNSTIVVIGGWGLVGASMCRKIMEFNPKKIIVTSLKQSEAEEAVEELRKEFSGNPPEMFEPWWGNIFSRTEWKDVSREDLLTNDVTRSGLIHDVIDELDDRILSESALYSLLQQTKPDAVIDCVNTATAIAYQDIYASSRSILSELEAGNTERMTVERLLASLYIPQLTRHIQVLYRGLKDAKTTTYIKVGTSGTGGMGLNIPYTHSEEQPSRILLAKSAVAGAQTLLLFLMARTPNSALVKEIKPSAAIAWKKIGYGDVMRKGKSIPLVDMIPENAMSLNEGTFSLKAVEGVKDFGENFKSVFIDTGENGIFSRAEFETISSLGQMELVTPEEIADAVVNELRGGNSGLDVIGALDASVMGPTYRGGILRNNALDQLKALEIENSVDSVAFEMLGPPRLSKLLYEAYILKRIAVDFETAITMSIVDLSKKAEMLISSDATLRAQMLSVGLVILLPDGVNYLRGNDVKIPPYRGQVEIDYDNETIEKWCNEGWVDLREQNFLSWQIRLKRIMDETALLPRLDTSSRYTYTKNYWENFQNIDGGKLAAWIFEVEEHGWRFKR
ncbi:MAG: short-chain dehydrogenase [Ignavibacteria bacterium]|nr:short-chain dehydrogenase [Ignavibacteria bacterium]